MPVENVVVCDERLAKIVITVAATASASAAAITASAAATTAIAVRQSCLCKGVQICVRHKRCHRLRFHRIASTASEIAVVMDAAAALAFPTFIATDAFRFTMFLSFVNYHEEDANTGKSALP